MPREIMGSAYEPNTLRVGKIDSIQSVLNDSTPGTDVIVPSGEYEGHIFVNSGINVIGTGLNCLLDGDVFVAEGGAVTGIVVKQGHRVVRTGRTTEAKALDEPAYPDLFTLPDHGLQARDKVTFARTVGEIKAGVVYYVRDFDLYSDKFSVALAPVGMSAISLSPHTNEVVKVDTDDLNRWLGEDTAVTDQLESLRGDVRIVLADNLKIIRSVASGTDVALELASATAGERVVFEGNSITGDFTIPEGVTLVSQFQGAEIIGDVSLGIDAHIAGFKISGEVSGAGFKGFSEIRVGESKLALCAEIDDAIKMAAPGAYIYLEDGVHTVGAESRSVLVGIEGDLHIVGSGASTLVFTIPPEDIETRYYPWYGTQGTIFLDSVRVQQTDQVDPQNPIAVVFNSVALTDCPLLLHRVIYGKFKAVDSAGSLDFYVGYLCSTLGVTDEITGAEGLISQLKISGYGSIFAQLLTGDEIIVTDNFNVVIQQIITTGRSTSVLYKSNPLLVSNNKVTTETLVIVVDSTYLAGSSLCDTQLRWTGNLDDMGGVMIFGFPAELSATLTHDITVCGLQAYLVAFPEANPLPIVHASEERIRSAWTKANGYYSTPAPVPVGQGEVFHLSNARIKIISDAITAAQVFVLNDLMESVDGNVKIPSNVVTDAIFAASPTLTLVYASYEV